MKKDLMVIIPTAGGGKCPECKGKEGECTCEDEIDLGEDESEDDLGMDMGEDTEELDDLSLEDAVDSMDMENEESEDEMESGIMQALKDEDPITFEAELKKLFDKWMKEKA